MHGMAIMMMLLMMLLGVAVMVFWIWTLIDCLTNKRLTETQKVVWTLVIVFVGWVGALIYFFAGRSPKVYVPASPYYYPPQGYTQPVGEQAPGEDYRSYQEGYRAREQSQTSSFDEAASASEESPAQQQVQHEQIQISYPE